MRERSRALWTRLGQLDPRYLVSFLITLVLVLGEARYGILGGYDRLAVALGVCVATELALSRWLRGRFANPQSAYITGISLALLIKPRVDLLWPFALGGFLAIAALRHWIVGGPLLAEIAPITGPMYQLFIFFMITDPKTTVSTVRGRIIVAATVAVAEAAIRLSGDFHVAQLSRLYPAPPILALAIVGPVANLIDLVLIPCPPLPSGEGERRRERGSMG